VHAEGYSCYHEGAYPGGVARSRSLVAEIFDLNKLSSWKQHFRQRAVNIPVNMHELGPIGVMGRTWASRYYTAKVGLRMTQNKLGRHLVGMGQAVQGRMLELLLQHGAEIWRESPVTDFVVENGRVTGVVVQRDGGSVRVAARNGVLVDAGGFARNLQMRQQYQPQPASVDWTNANPGDTGEMIQKMVALGAGLGNMDQAVWTPISIMPNGTRAIHPGDMSKPHCIMVDAGGQRFVNESTSYLDLGNAMYRRNREVPAVPAWYIMESRFRRYRWFGTPPGEPPKEWLDSGYMKKAGSVEELARLCGIDAAGLKHRGESAYDKFWGDVTNRPNPNLGAIERGPFYAVQAWPGDVGTYGGVLVDEHSRVLRDDGTFIPGLYATGNSTASFTGASYPGAGASIGGAYVFGYVAAKHACAA
jgi:3-oxosteroid 1-dehydrogenase